MFENTLKDPASRVDRLQLAAIAGLMLLGGLFVYSATTAREAANVAAYLDQAWFRQIVWYAVGLGAATAVCFVDYHTLARWSVLAYWGTLLLLVAVMIPGIGTSHGWGAQCWIDFGPFQIQPSEFAKVAFLLAFANYLSRPADELRLPAVFWKAMGMLALPFLLILVEPDLGSAIVLLPTGLIMLFVAGVPRRFLWRLVGAAGLVVALCLAEVLFAPPNWQFGLKEYQRHRLLVLFGADFVPRGASAAEAERLRKLQWERSYQVRQAMISVGSGGFWGKGWCQGNQTALGFLPLSAAHNDFIFSVIAEEKGFVGSVSVLTLYGVILFTGLRIAGQARDRLGRLLAVGVVALVFSHVFINIGMNIRLMPVTGIPLPLLSYGGSSVLCSLIAMGLMQNVYMYRRGY